MFGKNEEKKKTEFLKKQFKLLKECWNTDEAMIKAKNAGLTPPIKINSKEVVQSVARATIAEYGQECLDSLLQMVCSEKISSFQDFVTRNIEKQ